ncbi:hypothetical protein MBM_04212 [Drepanopeziza brunnea f. sp. 'multigermtubi' MB_m1]|uniref:Uncharacterized protein n=1 Tax=Marssonina brunnea f. sp. multigermtubi (strain MB_m1) TaxID=1072389 RepID=K1WWC0_MARBU|nr:uncharacterized protein MBM_04212 [Drepanopeziza brunnea f. sp. 'multigermtubi' MB_m1]EKD17351.1 hypothetical protein MBM_04212 [Drepanopeziza brunnea f. sp. 'multigermtubi' MB_m1]
MVRLRYRRVINEACNYLELQSRSFRTHTNIRAQDKKAEITLESLIKDITDEAKANDSTRTIYGQALYGNKSNSINNLSGYNKSKAQLLADKRLDYKHCKQPKPLHSLEDCFVINKELREAFEKRTSKKSVLYFQRKRGNKKKDDEEVDDEIFSFALLLSLDSTNNSINSTLHKDRWLYDTKAIDHVCNDPSKFFEYIARDDLPFMSSLSSLIRPFGIGTCIIKSFKTNRKRVLKCYNTLYVL